MGTSVFAALLFYASNSNAAAVIVTPEMLNMYLAEARSVWGIEIVNPVEIRMDYLGTCNLTDLPLTAKAEVLMTETTISFEEGTRSVSSIQRYLIQINSACHWSPPWLRNTIIHEIGHIVIGMDYHSKDKHSVMYFAVSEDGRQRILASDRVEIPQRSQDLGSVNSNDSEEKTKRQPPSRDASKISPPAERQCRGMRAMRWWHPLPWKPEPSES